jgi:hypothetical protein
MGGMSTSILHTIFSEAVKYTSGINCSSTTHEHVMSGVASAPKRGNRIICVRPAFEHHRDT